ncbi:MAG: hypothetical protein ACP5MH_12255 [Thermoproteus sp.]
MGAVNCPCVARFLLRKEPRYCYKFIRISGLSLLDYNEARRYLGAVSDDEVVPASRTTCRWIAWRIAAGAI